jgi:hypothetical protein
VAAFISEESFNMELRNTGTNRFGMICQAMFLFNKGESGWMREREGLIHFLGGRMVTPAMQSPVL